MQRCRPETKRNKLVLLLLPGQNKLRRLLITKELFSIEVNIDTDDA